jgi:hypothetical protein
MRDTKLIDEARKSRDWYMANGSKVTGKLIADLLDELEAEYLQNETLRRNGQKPDWLRSW